MKDIKTILCTACKIYYEDVDYDDCPCCKLRKLLKMAEDELIESDNHGRAQQKRADALEAEVEMLRERNQKLYDHLD